MWIPTQISNGALVAIAAVIGFGILLGIWRWLRPPKLTKLLGDGRYQQAIAVYARALQGEDPTRDDRRAALAAAITFLANEHDIPSTEGSPNMRLVVAAYDREQSYDLRGVAADYEEAGEHESALACYERAARLQEEHDPKDYKFLQQCIARVSAKITPGRTVWQRLWPPTTEKFLEDDGYRQALAVYLKHLRTQEPTREDRRAALAAAIAHLVTELGIPPTEASPNMGLVVAAYDRDQSYDLREDAEAYEEARDYESALACYERAARLQEEHDPKDFQFLKLCIARVSAIVSPSRNVAKRIISDDNPGYISPKVYLPILFVVTVGLILWYALRER